MPGEGYRKLSEFPLPWKEANFLFPIPGVDDAFVDRFRVALQPGGEAFKTYVAVRGGATVLSSIDVVPQDAISWANVRVTPEKNGAAWTPRKVVRDQGNVEQILIPERFVLEDKESFTLRFTVPAAAPGPVEVLVTVRGFASAVITEGLTDTSHS